MSTEFNIQVGLHTIGGEELFFLIEEGNANDGNFSLALEMIDLAADCGASAIEFQLAISSDFYVKDDPAYERYKKREFSENQIRQLIKRASAKGLDFVAAPLSHNLIEILVKAGCSAFTINASDLTNPAIIDKVGLSGKPIFLGLLFADANEIQWALSRLKSHGADNIVLLHGQHTMASSGKGVAPDKTSLGYIQFLEILHKIPVGFIDHTSSIWMPACAAASGALVVTKHLIKSRKGNGYDLCICLEPEEMKEAISRSRMIYKSRKDKSSYLLEEEMPDKKLHRRSIVASRTLKAGVKLKYSDFSFKRPGTGLEPWKYQEMIGKVIKRDIKYDEQIIFSDLLNA